MRKIIYEVNCLTYKGKAKIEIEEIGIPDETFFVSCPFCTADSCVTLSKIKGVKQ